MDNPYKIFASEGWDWFVAAKYLGPEEKPEVMYSGHDLDSAYLSILQDQDIEPEIIEKDMYTTGTYEPTIEDFLEDSEE